jgi:hypothetical protein
LWLPLLSLEKGDVGVIMIAVAVQEEVTVAGGAMSGKILRRGPMEGVRSSGGSSWLDGMKDRPSSLLL